MTLLTTLLYHLDRLGGTLDVRQSTLRARAAAELAAGRLHLRFRDQIKAWAAENALLVSFDDRAETVRFAKQPPSP